jgi:hypothetical protein
MATEIPASSRVYQVFPNTCMQLKNQKWYLSCNWYQPFLLSHIPKTMLLSLYNRSCQRPWSAISRTCYLKNSIQFFSCFNPPQLTVVWTTGRILERVSLELKLYRAHISGHQTPGSTRSSPPFYITNVGVNPGLKPGFGVLRCGPSSGEICRRSYFTIYPV